jgi:hypothetical protein
VIAADRGGSIRETVEMARVYAEVQKSADAPELIRELAGSRPDADDLQHEGQPRDLHEVLREALAILEAKATPEEVDAYKHLCLGLAERVAARTKSGGVLGIGGERVSDDEQAALDSVKATLGL